MPQRDRIANRFFSSEPSNEKSAINDYLHSKLVSLEEAIRPVAHIVADIFNHAATAKAARMSPADNLTQDESAAIYLYTMETDLYFKLNNALRMDMIEKVKPWFLYLKLLYTALNKLPSTKAYIWRGITGNIKSQYTKNSHLIWPGVTSASLDLNAVDRFLSDQTHCTVFFIQCQYGKSVANHSAFPEEQEIILMPDTKLVVKGSLMKFLFNIVQLEEQINPNANNNLAILPEIKESIPKEQPSWIKSKVLPPLSDRVVSHSTQWESEKQNTIDNCE